MFRCQAVVGGAKEPQVLRRVGSAAPRKRHNVVVLKPSFTIPAFARCFIDVSAPMVIALAHFMANLFGNVAAMLLVVGCFFAARRNCEANCEAQGERINNIIKSTQNKT